MSATISPQTHVGPVHVTVSDLERSIAYYEEAIGLVRRSDAAGTASLGGGDELLVLVEEPGAAPAPGTTGLFHFALLVPSRKDLGEWLAHASRADVQLTGASDHGVSEALYLRDPDGHGVEIYADRPREGWGEILQGTIPSLPLDLDSLLAELDDAPPEHYAGLPAATTMGHVHLRVSDIPQTIAFYRDVLGFDLIASMGSAAFLSAGGYHHHIGANVWESAGGSPPPRGSASLRHATVVLPDQDELERVLRRLAASERVDGGVAVLDPSGNKLVLTAQR